MNLGIKLTGKSLRVEELDREKRRIAEENLQISLRIANA